MTPIDKCTCYCSQCKNDYSMTRWAMEAQSSTFVEAGLLERAIATIRELKKDLKLADFLSDKLEEKIAGLEKENEELKERMKEFLPMGMTDEEHDRLIAMASGRNPTKVGQGNL